MTRGFRGNGRAAMAALAATALLTAAPSQAQLDYVDQGASWDDAARAAFYTQDQGSELIPYNWLGALTTSEGQPFLFDGLARYGYLPNEFRPGSSLPIGFSLSGVQTDLMVGMTCAACHTRNIVVDGNSYRIDGGPAIVDFQAFLTDLVDAVGRLTTDKAQFAVFAGRVLGPSPAAGAADRLAGEVKTWYDREDAMRQGSYARPDLWGLGRLDAITMIFNRVTGIDLAVPPAISIPENIHEARAPTRYPFVWNAPRQKVIQWPGFAPNGSELFGLARNAGEVYGVFGRLKPVIKTGLLANTVASWNSGANWSGLVKAERLVMRIGAPAWPWPDAVDLTRAKRGKAIFKQQCGSCHAKIEGPPALGGSQPTWTSKQPLVDVDTDGLQNQLLHTKVDSGILAGVRAPLSVSARIPPQQEAIKLLSTAVGGSILETGQWAQTIDPKKIGIGQITTEVLRSFLAPKPAKQTNPYESRVLYGIWAAAPYLHNGSVPTLADLLKPASERPTSFPMGPVYDIRNVGIAATQPGSYVMTTTGCDAPNSGNSRCGHEFGTKLLPDQKLDLLEYLKVYGSPGWTD